MPILCEVQHQEGGEDPEIFAVEANYIVEQETKLIKNWRSYQRALNFHTWSIKESRVEIGTKDKIQIWLSMYAKTQIRDV